MDRDKTWSRVKGPTVCSINDEDCSPPGGQIRLGWCGVHYWRVRRHGDPSTVLPHPGNTVTGSDRKGGLHFGEDHHFWQGDDISNTGVHSRLYRYRGSASTHTCVRCGAQAVDWSYTRGCPDEKQSDRGPYCVHTDECYEPLCQSCHSLKDRAA